MRPQLIGTRFWTLSTEVERLGGKEDALPHHCHHGLIVRQLSNTYVFRGLCHQVCIIHESITTDIRVIMIPILIMMILMIEQTRLSLSVLKVVTGPVGPLHPTTDSTVK